MLRRWTFQHVVAALLVPLLLVVGTGSARAMFRCEYDKVAREACCCPKSHEPPETGTETSFTKGCCCDVETVKAGGASSQARAQVERFDASKLHQVLLVAFLDVADPVQAPALVQAISTADHPPVGPPLTLLKRSFLI